MSAWRCSECGSRNNEPTKVTDETYGNLTDSDICIECSGETDDTT